MNMVVSASTAFRNAYSGNTLFSNDSYRKVATNKDVVSADRKALSRQLDMLGKLDYDDKSPENTKSIYNRLMSYVDVYNNTVESGNESSSSDVKNTIKEMKKFSKEYSGELEKLGITIKNNGQLKVDTKTFKTATTRQVSRIFSGDTDYAKGLKKLTSKLRKQLTRMPDDLDSTALDSETVASMTGAGISFDEKA